MVANLAPRKMKFGVSEGMVLAASGDSTGISCRRMPARSPECGSSDRPRSAPRRPAQTLTRARRDDRNAVVPCHRRDRGVACHRRARTGSAAGPSLHQSRAVSGQHAVALALAIVAGCAIDAPPAAMVLPLGLPDLPFHLQLDALSAVFLLLLGGASAAIFPVLGGLLPHERGPALGVICFRPAFLAAMALVLVADDAYVFMVAWETMALASFFLVTTEHRIPEIRCAPASCTC